MNRSFDSLKLVNTYGAFGSIGKERTEIVIKGAYQTGIVKPYCRSSAGLEGVRI
jgi:hypothetical protein